MRSSLHFDKPYQMPGENITAGLFGPFKPTHEQYIGSVHEFYVASRREQGMNNSPHLLVVIFQPFLFGK